MRKNRLQTISFFILILFITLPIYQVLAVNAYPKPVQYIQPDRTKLTIILYGDEFIHWATTLDGFTLLSNTNGGYEYAILDKDGNLTFSGIQANDPDKRAPTERIWLQLIQPNLFFSKNQIGTMRQLRKNGQGGAPNIPLTGGFPSTGTRKLLMILANFSNTTTTYTQTNFDNLMNQISYNGTGSFRDYYLEVSYGQLTVNTTVTIWVTLPQTHDYYGPETKWGEFAYDAVVAANQQAGVDYSQFDNDSDGIVDGVTIIHQGRGQEESGNTNDIWSHSWDLASAGYTTAQRTFDGVEVYSYTANPEKFGTTNMTNIGVLCHEFGHNLGSPDFYDTDYGTNGQYNGTGYWDLMASGSWNGLYGDKPAHPNAWIKSYFAWTNPTVLSTQQTIVLRNAQIYPDVVRYNTLTANEYFLCENRQQTGFDVGIPGHGMIIYHVDGNYISTHMNSNDINISSHQGMYPMSAISITANGIMPSSSSNINTAGCPWPGTGSKTTFTDATIPNSLSWAAANTEKPLINIAENTTTGEISFCFIGCEATITPCPGIPTVTYGGQTYNTVQIGTQCWFRENLNIGTRINGVLEQTDNNTIEKYCYNDLESNCNTYGGLYQWNELMQYSTTPGTQGICPSGWLIPTDDEFCILTTFLDGTVNCSTNGWTGTDAGGKMKENSASYWSSPNTGATNQSGFTAFPAGSRYPDGNFYSLTHAGIFWTSTQSDAGSSWRWDMDYNRADILRINQNKIFGLSVRCIKDTCTNYSDVSISIGSSANPVCFGTSVTFSATPTNGGTTPSYLWKVNGINAGTNSSTFNYTPANTDQVICILTSNETCATGSPATSNTITMAVNPLLPVSVSLSASANPVCAGDTVCYTATVTNGGSNPIYTWMVNGNINEGLIAYYPFNGNANDESGNGNNGTNYGATLTTDRFGNSGKAYSFDGTNDHIEVPDNPTLRFNDSFSISIWVSLTNPYPLNYNLTLIGKSLGSTYPDSYAIYTGIWTGGDTSVCAAYCNNTTCKDNCNIFTLKVNTWYNIIWAFNKTLNEETFYINGTLIKSQPITSTIEYDSHPLAIGRGFLYGSFAEFVGGKLDDIRLYNRALTTTEILQLYHDGDSTFCYVPSNGDSVYCVLTSSYPCATNNPDTSNVIVMTVNPALPVSVSISASANPICAGDTVCFTATATNGGSNPTFTWIVNGNINDGLIAYYPFNGNANDESGNGYNGTPLNGVSLTIDRFDSINRAYSFDGIDDYIVASNSQNLDLGTNYTISAWVLSDAPTQPTYGVCYTIIAKRDEVMSGNAGLFPWNFAIPYSESPTFSKLFNGRTGSYGYSNGLVTFGIWQYVAVTVENDIAKFWINGAESGSYAYMTPNFTTTQPVLIGWNRAGGTCYEQFKGKIDDIRIYNRPLSVSEIQQLFHEGDSTFCYVPSNGDSVYCVLTSNYPCATNNPDTSNVIVMTVNPALPVSVTISASANPVCAGDTVCFTATPINADTNTVFTWMVNGNINEGLIAYYPFNGNSEDESGNGNNGTNYGATLTTDRFGNSGKAYSFDGTNDHIEVPDNPTLRFNDSFSISLWVSLTNPYPLNYNMTLIDKSLGSTYPDSYAIYTGIWTGGDTSVCAAYCNNSTCKGNDNIFTLNLNSWYNIIWVFNKTLNKETFYINGNLIKSQPISNTIEYDSHPLAIGRGLLYGSFAEFVGGKLDDIRLYNRALTSTEILQLYHDGDSTFCYVPSNGDSVYCVLTSSYPCATNNPDTSNVIVMTVNPALPVSVSNSASANPVCSGDTVCFTATATNGGSNPIFTWFVNGNINDGLVAFYPFNGNSNDVSGNSNNGTNHGALQTSNRFGKMNSAYSFNGINNYISIPNSPSLSISSELTIAFWMKSNTVPPINHIPISKRNPDDSEMHWVILNDIGRGTTFQYSGESAPHPHYEIASPVQNVYPALYDGEWHFIVMQHSYGTTGNSKIYIDNQNYATNYTGWYSQFNYPAVTVADLLFGKQNAPGAEGWYSGLLDDIRIFNRTLSEKEIAALFFEGDSTFCYVPSDGDSVYCIMTSSYSCATNNPDTSNVIVMTVNPVLPVSVSISAAANPVCGGTPVTFTATPTNGGTTPSYEWKVNGVIAGTNSPVYTYAPSNNDLLQCILTSNETCTTDNPDTSNTITMTVNPLLPVSGSIAASANPVCAGIPVTFTAIPTNGGTTPFYEWKVNGVTAGTNNPVFSYTPVNNDQVQCILTSNETCTSGNPDTSNTIIMTVNPLLPVSVSIAASVNPVCAGIPVTFTAIPTNGGTTPSYEWKVNGVTAGTNSSVFSYTPANNDQVYCILTSNVTCPTGNPATSNTVVMVAIPAPAVSLNICNTITTRGAQPFGLKGGIPLGGIYSGTGVIGNTFYPSLVPIGQTNVQITYDYLNSYGCSGNAMQNITVLEDMPFICSQVMTDVRDNAQYPTILIGGQCWMATSLNIGSMISSGTMQFDNCIAEKYCYGDNDLKCDSLGGLYQWDELMQYDDAPLTQGLCPPAWHIPDENEWGQLFNYFGGNGFSGDPLRYDGSSGFNALLGGARFFNKAFKFKNFTDFFWSSTRRGNYKAWSHAINSINHGVSYYPSLRNNAFSVRCIKN